VEVTFQDVGIQAHNKNIKLQLINNTTTKVICDSFMINTILRNLVSNAIKFSDPQKTISVIINEYEPDNNHLLISVKDEGIGMDPASLNLLFRLDAKLSTTGTSGETGTGLGLILCKEFIQKHNCKM